jgi:hypothetical protein
VYINRREETNMMEFIFGAVIGIWAAQQFTLPNVQLHVKNWWSPPAETTEQPVEDNFSGNMPEE